MFRPVIDLGGTTMLTLVTAALFAFPLATGGIVGDLRLGDKYLPDQVLKLKCGEEAVEGKTDKAGSFRLTVKGGGKCQLTLTYEKQAVSLDVVVFEQPARYRLVLEAKDGKYALKRA
jgi:hypothetical protein